ncbi:hypothetical protein MMC12_000063 [Toensbergia leucococca]|nr:hypothetical protein [Toensbergia leucococca]
MGSETSGSSCDQYSDTDDQTGHLAYWVAVTPGAISAGELGLYWPWDFDPEGAIQSSRVCSPFGEVETSISKARDSWGPAYDGVGSYQDLKGGDVIPFYFDEELPKTYTSSWKIMRPPTDHGSGKSSSASKRKSYDDLTGREEKRQRTRHISLPEKESENVRREIFDLLPAAQKNEGKAQGVLQRSKVNDSKFTILDDEVGELQEKNKDSDITRLQKGLMKQYEKVQELEDAKQRNADTTRGMLMTIKMKDRELEAMRSRLSKLEDELASCDSDRKIWKRKYEGVRGLMQHINDIARMPHNF